MLLEETQGAPGAAPSWESAEHWGDTKQKGGMRVAPEMTSFVAKRQSEKNAIDKEKRKAAEGKPVKPKKGKGDQKGKEPEAP